MCGMTEIRITAKYGSKGFEAAKAAIKNNGGRWDSVSKTWTIGGDTTELVDIYVGRGYAEVVK